MTRVKRGVMQLKTRRNILKKAKGYRFGRSKKEIQAREALVHAGKYAFAHRKDQKGVTRRLAQVRMSAPLKAEGISYSKFIDAMKKKDIQLNRIVLSIIAKKNPESFSRITAKVRA